MPDEGDADFPSSVDIPEESKFFASMMHLPSCSDDLDTEPELKIADIEMIDSSRSAKKRTRLNPAKTRHLKPINITAILRSKNMKNLKGRKENSNRKAAALRKFYQVQTFILTM